jgi:hypothetical protein
MSAMHAGRHPVASQQGNGMLNIYYTAEKTGNWNDANIWKGKVAPGSTVPQGSVVTISPGITVTIPAGYTLSITNGHMYLNGALAVQGTLALTISGARDPQRQDFFDTLIDASGTLTVASGGQMTIVSQGYVSSGTPIPVHAINVSGGLTNQGSIVMTCSMYCPSPGSFGRGYGISLHGGTLDNRSSITITSTSVQHDGDGPPYAINCYSGTVRNRSGCNITSTPPAGGIPAGGTIRILQGAFANEGTFLNYGEFANNGAGSNSGRITQVYPAAAYSGSGTVTGAGSVQLQGTLGTALSLDKAMPGQSNFSVPNGQSLTVNAPFTIPATYTLDCQGGIVNNSLLTNNGTLKWNLGSATFSGRDSVPGTGRLEIYGTLSTPGEFDVNKLSQSICIRGGAAVTIAAGAVLLAPRNTTLTIESGASLTTQAGTTSLNPGILWFGGTVINSGTLTNTGILKYQFPSGTLNGAVSGNGRIALQGYLNVPLDLTTLPSSNFVIMAGDTLDLALDSLTVPSGKTLTVQGGAPAGILTYNSATIFIAGTLVNNGTIGTTASSNATIVHCFPTASYSGNPPTKIQQIQLQGTAPTDVNLSTLGYGTAIAFGIANPGPGATVTGTLIIPSGCMLVCSGSLSGGTVSILGTFVYNFDTASLNFQTVTSFGTVCLNGIVKDTKTYAQVTQPFRGLLSYQVRRGDQLVFENDTSLQAGTRLTVLGTLAVNSCTLTLNTPLPNGQNISATVEVMAGASFSNDGTIALRNTQYVGLWFRNMSLGTHPSYPTNSGTIDASVDQSLFCFNANCAVLVENTKLDNSNNGTVRSGPAGRPTIYCNSGLICGGTLDGPPPTGSGMPPNTGTTYSSAC